MKSIKKLTTGLLALGLLAACGPQGAGTRAAELDAGAGIIGGVNVTQDSQLARYVVGIYDLKAKGLCTGTLIAKNLVLTAGHCISEDTSNMVVVFNVDFSKAKKEDVRPVVGAARASNYTEKPENGRDMGDIAVIRFAGEPAAGYTAMPILPERYVSLFREGQLMLLAGYGLSDGVNKTGSGLLRSVGVRIALPKFSRTEVVLDQTQGKGACHGDSGGPAILIVGKQPYVWGVTSRGVADPKDHCSVGAVYTNAAVYGEFIMQASQHLNRLQTRPAPELFQR